MLKVTDVVILTKEEYEQMKLTREERDAIVYAIRMIKMADLMKSPDAYRLTKTLSGVWKKMEGLDA